MSDLNNCVFTGRLTKDCESKTVGAKGSLLVTFSIANNTGFGDYAKTQFFDVQLWGKRGEALQQYLTKGKQVAVVGQLEQNKWQGQDGQEHFSWRLNASDVQLLASPKAENATPSAFAPRPQVADEGEFNTF